MNDWWCLYRRDAVLLEALCVVTWKGAKERTCRFIFMCVCPIFLWQCEVDAWQTLYGMYINIHAHTYIHTYIPTIPIAPMTTTQTSYHIIIIFHLHTHDDDDDDDDTKAEGCTPYLHTYLPTYLPTFPHPLISGREAPWYFSLSSSHWASPHTGSSSSTYLPSSYLPPYHG